jgi:CDP-Glycerol:Poly(glycerophosphate) glycerophosphotransferase
MTRRRILFFAKVPMNYALFQPVHERLAAHPSLEFVFTGKHQGGGDPALVYRSFDLLGGRLMRNAFARFRKFDVYVSPDYRLAGKRCRVKVHMFHGFSIRNFAIQERARDFDKLFLIGPYMRRRFIDTGILAPDDPRIEEVGMPKLDALVNGVYTREQVCRSLDLDPAEPTVLFAPTWIKGGCLDRHGPALLDALARLPYNVIVKLHDNSFDSRKQRYDWANEVKARVGPRLVFARGADSNPYLMAADVLVSDASSIANEYLLLDRPLVFFRVGDLEADWPATDRETWGTKTGRVIDTVAELDRAVELALSEPNAESAIRKAAVADFFYAPGTATDRAAERILRYAEVAAS